MLGILSMFSISDGYVNSLSSGGSVVSIVHQGTSTVTGEYFSNLMISIMH